MDITSVDERALIEDVIIRPSCPEVTFKLDATDAEYLCEEVYDIIRTIRDPEFPQTLE